MLLALYRIWLRAENSQQTISGQPALLRTTPTSPVRYPLALGCAVHVRQHLTAKAPLADMPRRPETRTIANVSSSPVLAVEQLAPAQLTGASWNYFTQVVWWLLQNCALRRCYWKGPGKAANRRWLLRLLRATKLLESPLRALNRPAERLLLSPIPWGPPSLWTINLRQHLALVAEIKSSAWPLCAQCRRGLQPSQA